MAERALLVEIGVEELPIHAVDDLARAFAQAVAKAWTAPRDAQAEAAHG
jgi:glycyl-tRNA synthetase beta subunit